jgi:hypothetical protein
MDPKTPQFWAKILWKHFEPQVASGDPVYFAIDASLISKLLKENFPLQSNHDTCKAEEYLNIACSKLLRLGKSKVTVDPIAYRKLENGFSCSIVLAAQQILVAEEMAEAENFSQDAYFPRYQKKINFKDPGEEKKSNPFKLEDFVEIWESLKKDILSIPAANRYSITFKEGSGPKNYSRNYPISQALFSQNDLQKLRKLANVELGTSNLFVSKESAQRFFDRHKWELTKRARDKIRIEKLRQGLYSQIQNYLSISGRNLPDEGSCQSGKNPKSFDRGFFVASSKATGFRKTNCLRYKIGFEKNYYGEQMLGYLDDFTSDGGIFILTRTDGILGYSNKETYGEIKEGDSFILFGKSEMKSELILELEKIFGRIWVEIFKKFDVEGLPAYSFYICRGLPEEFGVLPYKSGRLISGFTLLRKRLTCWGGIILDKTQNLYLKYYPPENFVAGSYVLSHDDIINVNGMQMSLNKFRERLLEDFDYDSFSVEYEGFRVNLKTASARETQEDIKFIGFDLVDGKYFSPLADENNFDATLLRGWVCPFDEKGMDKEKRLELELFEAAWLMREIDRSWIPVNEEAIKMVIESLPEDIPGAVRKVLSDRLFTVRALPGTMVIRHEILEITNVG